MLASSVRTTLFHYQICLYLSFSFVVSYSAIVSFPLTYISPAQQHHQNAPQKENQLLLSSPLLSKYPSIPAMTSRDVVPAAKGHPSATESPISQRLPGGVRSFVTDHNVARPSHVPTDYINTTKPLPLIGATPLHGAGSARPHTLRPERERERGFFSSDDTALTKQILATHAPDIEELNVKPVLYIVEDILRLGKPLSSETSTHVRFLFLFSCLKAFKLWFY